MELENSLTTTKTHLKDIVLRLVFCKMYFHGAVHSCVGMWVANNEQNTSIQLILNKQTENLLSLFMLVDEMG